MIENTVFNTKETHFKAMALAQEAHLASINGKEKETLSLYEQAFDLEKQAALSLLDKEDIEPTRSVLFRSAAALAKKCHKYREAEKMIAHGLAGNPPDDIATELRLLFDDIKKQYLPKKSVHKVRGKIVLLNGIPESGLAAGDVGTVIYSYEKGTSFKVEFVRFDGAIVAIETLSAQQVRSIGKQDMLHSRHLSF
jgi:hypothetical protein